MVKFNRTVLNLERICLIRGSTIKIKFKKSFFIKKVSIFLSTLVLVVSLTTSSFSNFELNSIFYSPSEVKKFTEIHALLDTYGSFITTIENRNGDIAFQINDSWIYYCEGKMLTRENLKIAREFTSIFYEYNKGMLKKIPHFNGDKINMSHDFWDFLFGKTEREVRKHYYELKSNHRRDYYFAEIELNWLGYTLLRDKRFEDAIKISKLNRDEYPNSANTYDSLAEAYMKNGNRELAIENYRRSLELNPGNSNAKKMLKSLIIK